MKLTKDKLIRLTKKSLEGLGYQLFKDTISGAQGLYGKRVDKDLYLTLGLTIHRYYDFKFTASFYLSQNTIWSAWWGDMPKELYERIGSFLIKEERRTLLNEVEPKDGARDGWWDLEDTNAITNFLEAVKITENRFLTQLGLIDKIRNSNDIQQLQQLTKETLENIDNLNEGFNYQYTPPKNIDNIPIGYFKAAEEAIVNQNGILNANTVKRLAADAYRQKLMQ